jgi:hypothetical protein
MRHCTAHHDGMPLAVPVQIVDELAAAAQEAQIFDAFDRAADISIRLRHAPNYFC